MTEYQVVFPNEEKAVDQDQEWFLVKNGDDDRKLRVHDYDQVFSIPGLYEKVVVDHLKCDSPNVVCDLLAQQTADWVDDQDQIHVLDMGAGNGMVGEALNRRLDYHALVGVDIFPEAKQAALRDRPDLYDHYCVADLTTDDGVGRLEALPVDFNLLVTVAALGYGDIPVGAFINAFNMLQEGSLVAFNIKDRFLSPDDDTGYNGAIQGMCDGSMELLETHKYRHRVSMAGEPLYYVAAVGRKLRDADPDSCLAEVA